MMNKQKIVRPDECQAAQTLWFDRKKYVTVNIIVHRPKDVQVDIQDDYMILCCKNENDDVIYNEIQFYDRVLRFDSRERVYDRSINFLLRKITPDVAWPRLQKDPAKPSWIQVDFDNWRDWEHEEDDGMAEYEDYMDMMEDMTSGKKVAPPAMDDLSDLDDD